MRNVVEHFGFTHDSEFEPAWRRDKRVASPKYFPYYFQLAVPDTEVSQIELDRALDTATSVSAFVDMLSQFKTSTLRAPGPRLIPTRWGCSRIFPGEYYPVKRARG